MRSEREILWEEVRACLGIAEVEHVYGDGGEAGSHSAHAPPPMIFGKAGVNDCGRADTPVPRAGTGTDGKSCTYQDVD